MDLSWLPMIVTGDFLMAVPPLLSEEDVLSLLDPEHRGWRSDREGWVTVNRCGVAWRVHYRRGELLEVGWWGTLGRVPAWQGRGRAAARWARLGRDDAAERPDRPRFSV
jgi:hypothetical protein